MGSSDWSSDVCSSDLEGKKESLSASVPDLYGAVKGTSTPRLKNGVEKVDVLTPEEEEGMERGGEFVLRATKRRIKVVSMWVLFVFGCIVIGALGLAFLSLVGLYVYGVVRTGTVTEAKIGRASCREECVSTCRSRWSPYP